MYIYIFSCIIYLYYNTTYRLYCIYILTAADFRGCQRWDVFLNHFTTTIIIIIFTAAVFKGCQRCEFSDTRSPWSRDFCAEEIWNLYFYFFLCAEEIWNLYVDICSILFWFMYVCLFIYMYVCFYICMSVFYICMSVFIYTYNIYEYTYNIYKYIHNIY
jgi:hypothetical protein